MLPPLERRHARDIVRHCHRRHRLPAAAAAAASTRAPVCHTVMKGQLHSLRTQFQANQTIINKLLNQTERNQKSEKREKKIEFLEEVFN